MKIGSLPALRSSDNIDICLNNCKLNEADVVKYLGVYTDCAMTWSNQLSSICVNVYPKLRLLNRLSYFLRGDVLLKVYKQTLLPILDYGSTVWLDCPKAMSDKLESSAHYTQSRSKKVLTTDARKVWSTLAKESQGIPTFSVGLQDSTRFKLSRASYLISSY